jgi:hypothetical protein
MVVDDFAGQEDRPIGEPFARLVGVVHGAVHAVAETELAREADRRATRRELELCSLIDSISSLW